VLIRADVVAPIAAPAIRDGGVLIDGGRIVAVGRAAELVRRPNVGEQVDVGRCVLTPGLINAHTHLELSDHAVPSERPASFSDWIYQMARGRATRPPPEDRVPEAVAAGVAECLQFGVTGIGDISAFPDLSRPMLAKSPLRAVSFGEALGLAKAEPRFWAGLATAAKREHATDRLRIGLSPHAPYTVTADGYRAAVATHRPLATHLAESPEEAEFIRTGGGRFADVWQWLGGWEDDAVAPFCGSPVAFADAVGLLDVPTVLAHVNYVDADDLGRLAAGRASVVWCPRTHALFGHPPHRWREMLARGITVAIGTDSRATSPDLNLLAELRAIGGPAETLTLWRTVTLNAARALGLEDAGSLTPGDHADVAAWPLTGHGDPLRQLIHDLREPAAVWIGGDPVEGSASPKPSTAA
jgi:cytosine/adenosine deaminase-related metal-dependent hydrolase